MNLTIRLPEKFSYDRETITNALAFASLAHKGQKRKYDGKPYVSHPVAVSNILMNFSTKPPTEEQVIAALLHDTVEDTSVTLTEIHLIFGKEVMTLVDYVSDISTPRDGNRAERKRIDADWYAQGPAESQSIKVADLIHNSVSIKKNDPDFWKVYRKEKQYLLEVLTLADQQLVDTAYRQIKT